MKKVYLFVLLIMVGVKLYSQNICQSKFISHQIDSLCKVNNVKFCQVFFYFRENQTPRIGKEIRQSSENFKFDDCYLIMDKSDYYDLTKLIDFHIESYVKKPNERYIVLFFQGL